MSQLLNEIQAARMLGMSPAWVQRKRWSGGGPPFIKIDHAVRYRLEDLEEWINSRVRTSTSDEGHNGR